MEAIRTFQSTLPLSMYMLVSIGYGVYSNGGIYGIVAMFMM